jgi:hypothetical protein
MDINPPEENPYAKIAPIPEGYCAIDIPIAATLYQIPFWPGEHNSDASELPSLAQKLGLELINDGMLFGIVISIRSDFDVSSDTDQTAPYAVRLIGLDFSKTKPALRVIEMPGVVIGHRQDGASITSIFVAKNDAAALKSALTTAALSFKAQAAH